MCCEALAAGALTYLSKDVPMGGVLEAVRAAGAHARAVASPV